MNRGTAAASKFTVSRSAEDNDVFEINIDVSDLRAENLYLQTWGTAQILANKLWQIDIDTETLPSEGLQVLELGAGTGLVGLSAAILWHINVVLTDLSPIIPGLVHNVKSNLDILSTTDGRVSCGTLDWNNPDKLVLHNNKDEEPKILDNNQNSQASIVIAADCIYSEEHPELLTKAIFAWLKPGAGSRLIISYPLRVAYLDALRELWERLEQGGLEAIQEGREEIADEWDDETLHEWSVWHWKTTA